MAVTITSPITGAAQTGFTSPTYTLTTDNAPDNNGKQYAVTAIGGTQAGVTTHSVASPFTVTVTRPKVFKNLSKPNPTTGLIKDVPRNPYNVLTRKGVTPYSGQPYQTMLIKSVVDVPAGSDTYDPSNVRAAIAAHIGALWQISAGLGDTTVTGII